MPLKENVGKTAQVDKREFAIINASKFKKEFSNLKLLTKSFKPKMLTTKMNEGIIKLLTKLQNNYSKMSTKEKRLFMKWRKKIVDEIKNTLGLSFILLNVALSDKPIRKNASIQEIAFDKEIKKMRWTEKFVKEFFLIIKLFNIYSDILTFKENKRKRLSERRKVKKLANEMIWTFNKHCWKQIIQIQRTQNFAKAKKLLKAMEEAKIIKPPFSSPKYWQTFLKTKRVVARYAAKAPKTGPKRRTEPDKHIRLVKYHRRK